MEQSLQLQFLDFDDIDSEEVEFVQSILYSIRSPRVELPWVDQVEIQGNHWTQHPQYEGGGASGECSGEVIGAGGGEIYPAVQVPVATTIQQVYHQVVPQPIPPNLTAAAFVSNLAANVHGWVHNDTSCYNRYMQPNVGYVYPGESESRGTGGGNRRVSGNNRGSTSKGASGGVGVGGKQQSSSRGGSGVGGIVDGGRRGGGGTASEYPPTPLGYHHAGTVPGATSAPPPDVGSTPTVPSTPQPYPPTATLVMPPPPAGPPPLTGGYHHHHHHHQYHHPPPPHHHVGPPPSAAAQHAAGPPLYLSPAPLGMYHPQAIYTSYPPPAVYSPPQGSSGGGAAALSAVSGGGHVPPPTQQLSLQSSSSISSCPDPHPMQQQHYSHSDKKAQDESGHVLGAGGPAEAQGRQEQEGEPQAQQQQHLPAIEPSTQASPTLILDKEVIVSTSPTVHPTTKEVEEVASNLEKGTSDEEKHLGEEESGGVTRKERVEADKDDAGDCTGNTDDPEGNIEAVPPSSSTISNENQKPATVIHPAISSSPLPSQHQQIDKIKSLPPINAIKTTSLPSLPPVMKRRTEEVSSPSGGLSCNTQGVGMTQQSSSLSTPISQAPPTPPSASLSGTSATQSQQPPVRSWAGLFKASSPPLISHQHLRMPVQTSSNSITYQPTPPSSQQASTTGGVPQMRKPPLNAVAVAPPPTGDQPMMRGGKTQAGLIVRGSCGTSSSTPNQNHAGSVDSASSDKRQDDPVLRRIAESLSRYQLEHKAIVLTPRGLTNPSNYCYVNATLQALLACPPFYNLVKTLANNKSTTSTTQNLISPTPAIDSMVQFIREFSPAVGLGGLRRRERGSSTVDSGAGSQGMPSSIEGGVGPPFEPTYVYKMLTTLRREEHIEGRQEDAEEFLSLLLNGLHDEMLELSKIISTSKGSLSNGELANGETLQDDSSDWKEVTTKGTRVTRRAEFGRTPLSDIFMGQLRSRVQRSREESTDNVQPFFTLQLDIENSDSVGEALEKLVGWDPVEGLGHVQQTLDTLPCVLILHLKCFHYRHNTCSKIVKALEFPIDLRLDQKLLSSKMKMQPRSKQYKLFAVVYHDGKEATKGHYLSDVFHIGSGGWIRYDDSSVSQVSESQVQHPRPPRVPYLLYYRRGDTISSASSLPNPSSQHHYYQHNHQYGGISGTSSSQAPMSSNR